MKYLELVPYFRDRLIELFHKDTLDTYRVRHHNALSLIKELDSLLYGWENKNIKRAETLQQCINEVVKSVEKDEILVLNPYSKTYFIYVINGFSTFLKSHNNEEIITPRHKEELHKVSFLLRKLIKANQSIYLENHWRFLRSMLFQESAFEEKDFVPICQRIDNVIVSLAREILNVGYSKVDAFIKAKGFAKTKLTEDEFVALQKAFSGEKKKFTVVLQLYLKGVSDDASFAELHSSLPVQTLGNAPKIKDHFIRFISGAPHRRLYKCVLEAVDRYSAIKMAKKKLFAELDVLSLGVSRLKIEIYDKVLVIDHQGLNKDSYITLYSDQVVLDGTFANEEAVGNIFRFKLRKIKQNKNIDRSVIVRIDGALRHLRIANADSEIEQQFINYWIALEYIFSSPSVDENTFMRLRTNLKNILSSCYIERNLQNIEGILRATREMDSDTKLSAENITFLRDNTKSVLLKFRLSKLKSRLFNNREKRKNYLNNHLANLDAHLSRIYHLRNELIHEAAINQDIEDLTSNLKYYLVFVLNQMVNYYEGVSSENGSDLITMEHFFNEYRLLLDCIQEEWSMDVIRSVPFADELL